MRAWRERIVFHSVGQLVESEVVARDGGTGRVIDAYFDEETWRIRYVVIEIADAEGERSHVCSPRSILRIDEEAGRLEVDRLPAPRRVPAERLRSLRSLREILGCAVAGWTGSIGRAEDAVFETDSWALQFLLVDASSWCPGGIVFIQPALIEHAQWDRQALRVAVTRIEMLDVAQHEWPTAEAGHGSRSLH